ncbi:MAG: class I SAM-dependent methyltransferase [Nanoarchaeota archaeon]|nr:class I SAM-dependent methyltransferase [Nanoarchaeota archaeon]MBU1644357.1 class I SAM-dependent methyltransferase [Nanoarchaeota archaeon]MBU1977486.1 class I SAM-dependent methyltransferase [Nanoarchaeota archaeon]
MDAETDFFCGLLELHYGKKIEEELKIIADKISWAKGWPDKNSSFWNAEAFMWKYKIDWKTRALIKEELSFLDGKKNLDLGCGSYSYLPSVGFDVSEKMLLFNENCIQKVTGDLEKGLPFPDNSFESVTAIFLLNYVVNQGSLFSEIKRVLDEKGIFVAVLYSGKINGWQRKKEIFCFSKEEWALILEQNGFLVKCYEKENLFFFICRQRKLIK